VAPNGVVGGGQWQKGREQGQEEEKFVVKKPLSSFFLLLKRMVTKHDFGNAMTMTERVVGAWKCIEGMSGRHAKNVHLPL